MAHSDGLHLQSRQAEPLSSSSVAFALDIDSKITHRTPCADLTQSVEYPSGIVTNHHIQLPAKPHKSLFDILYSSEIYAKIWSVAQPELCKISPPSLFPEYTEPHGTEYVHRELSFWTSGFFPGSLYLLFERERRYKSVLRDCLAAELRPHPMQLEFACKWWTANLHQNASLTTTHDLGFMIFPWARVAWELNHDVKAYETIIRASRSLASRYSPSVGAFRSWDTCVTKRYSFQNPAVDFLVIIDNMMNLDMLFWAAYECDDTYLYQIAKSHARTSMEHHIRSDHSTAHVVVFDPETGALKSKLTHQGHSDESAWARGQSWAITGFAQTYHWTHDEEFLQAAGECADYFLAHMPASHVPPWDFTAPDVAGESIPPDTSAGVIAAYGMLLIHEAHTARGETSRYLQEALNMLAGIGAVALNPPSSFVALDTQLPVETAESGTKLRKSSVGIKVEGNGSPETILGGATINNYEFAPRRWADHGLVYADYYFLLCGNKLLEMKLTELAKDIIVE